MIRAMVTMKILEEVKKDYGFGQTPHGQPKEPYFQHEKRNYETQNKK